MLRRIVSNPKIEILGSLLKKEATRQKCSLCMLAGLILFLFTVTMVKSSHVSFVVF